MPIYRVNAAIVGGSFLGTVEADNAQHALRIVAERDDEFHPPSFCHQCADGCGDPEIMRIDVESEDGSDMASEDW